MTQTNQPIAPASALQRQAAEAFDAAADAVRLNEFVRAKQEGERAIWLTNRFEEQRRSASQ